MSVIPTISIHMVFEARIFFTRNNDVIIVNVCIVVIIGAIFTTKHLYHDFPICYKWQLMSMLNLSINISCSEVVQKTRIRWVSRYYFQFFNTLQATVKVFNKSRSNLNTSTHKNNRYTYIVIISVERNACHGRKECNDTIVPSRDYLWII